MSDMEVPEDMATEISGLSVPDVFDRQPTETPDMASPDVINARIRAETEQSRSD